jgi:TolA-binding protein
VVLEPPVIVVPAPAANDAPAPPITVTPAVPAYVEALETADRDFARGDYTASARNFQEYIRLVSAAGQRDHALYHLGLIYALPGPPAQDWTRATDFFNQLIKESPSSPYVPAANLILALRRQALQLTSDVTKREERIRQLDTELERLRRIDSDRRPR